eukprot:scaffold5313_cov41-Attheya_sp.AAC.2
MDMMACGQPPQEESEDCAEYQGDDVAAPRRALMDFMNPQLAYIVQSRVRRGSDVLRRDKTYRTALEGLVKKYTDKTGISLIASGGKYLRNNKKNNNGSRNSSSIIHNNTQFVNLLRCDVSNLTDKRNTDIDDERDGTVVEQWIVDLLRFLAMKILFQQNDRKRNTKHYNIHQNQQHSEKNPRTRELDCDSCQNSTCLQYELCTSDAILDSWRCLLLYPKLYSQVCFTLGSKDEIPYTEELGDSFYCNSKSIGISSRSDFVAWKRHCYAWTYDCYIQTYQSRPLETFWPNPDDYSNRDINPSRDTTTTHIHPEETIFPRILLQNMNPKTAAKSALKFMSRTVKDWSKHVLDVEPCSGTSWNASTSAVDMNCQSGGCTVKSPRMQYYYVDRASTQDTADLSL